MIHFRKLGHGDIITNMRIRKARKADYPEIFKLAAKYALDYRQMKTDDFFVADDGDKIVGICGLKKHRDCLELCSLGVDEAQRNKGLGARLVHAVLKKAKGKIYLTTTIPGFFEKFGFKKAVRFPESMTKKSQWCLECNKELCTVMARRGK